MKALEWSQHYSLIFTHSRAANSEVSDGILPKFKPIQAFIVDLVTCKNNKIHWKMNVLEWSQRFSHYKSMSFFPNAQGQLTHKSFIDTAQFLTHRKFMGVLVACKNEEDPIKNEGAIVVTTLFIDCSHAQGQLTPKSVIESCQILIPAKLSWLTFLPARMKKIHWKMKVVEWSQHFSHYKSMGIFQNAQGQLTHKSFVGHCPISNPSEILWVSLLPARMKKTQSKMKALAWSQHYSLIFNMLKGS